MEQQVESEGDVTMGERHREILCREKGTKRYIAKEVNKWVNVNMRFFFLNPQFFAIASI